MVYEEFVFQMNSLGFLVDEAHGQAFGSYRGLPVRCMFFYTEKARTARKPLDIKYVNAAVTVRKNPPAGFLKAAKKAMKGIAGVGYHKKFPDSLYMSLRTADGIADALDRAVNALLPVVEEYGMRPEDSCPLCRHGDCDGLALIQNIYRPVHHECLLHYHETVRQQAEKNLSEGSYLSGILGGLAGGIAATVPTILTIVFLRRIFAILMWLIPMGVSYGYKKCGGKRSKAAGPIMIFLSLLSLYMMEYVFWVINFTGMGYSYGEALSITLPFLLDPAFWVDMTKYAVIELLFLVLAIFMAWKPLTASAYGDIRAAAAAVDTYTEKRN